MTLIVCAKAQDGLALTSDSRGTFGDPQNLTAQNDNMKKVFKLSSHSVLLMSGAAEIGASIIHDITKEVKDKNLVGVTDVADHAKTKFKAKYEEWFSKYSPIPTQINPL